MESAMDWIKLTEYKPKQGQIVLTYQDGYYEVCVYRGSPHASWQTHDGKAVNPSLWAEIEAPILKEF